jgi:hypothetical protein
LIAAGRSPDHTAFADVLEGMAESNIERPAISAGLSVLHLVDRWLTDVPPSPETLAHAIHSARLALDRVSAGRRARGILAAVIDAVEGTRVPDVRRVAPRLLAYGRSLDYDAQWTLAADVFATIAHHSNPGLDPEIMFDAQMRLGYCLRMSGDLDGAQDAYREAGRVATSVNNRTEALHARVGDAAIASDRGNLPGAESILDEIIAAAAAGGYDDVHAIALHDRAYVANARGQYELGAKFAFEALLRTRSLTARDRILADLAMAFTQLGVLGAARDAFLVVVETAQEQYVRWAATINLLEIASLLPNGPLFEQYRLDLVGAALPPFLRAQYHYYCALGFRTFGQPGAAQLAMQSAHDLAEQYGYNQLLFQVENLADEMKRGEETRPLVVRETPVGLRHVAEAVSEMRQLVGV